VDEVGSLTPVAERAWRKAKQVGDVQAGAAVLGGPLTQTDDVPAEELLTLTQRSLPGVTTPEIAVGFGRQAPLAQAVQVFLFLPGGRPRFLVDVFFPARVLARRAAASEQSPPALVRYATPGPEQPEAQLPQPAEPIPARTGLRLNPCPSMVGLADPTRCRVATAFQNAIRSLSGGACVYWLQGAAQVI
jgi:hypothetical protein